MGKRRYFTSILFIILLAVFAFMPFYLFQKIAEVHTPSVQGTRSEKSPRKSSNLKEPTIIQPTPPDPIKEKISQMSLEEKVGQMFMGGSYKAEMFEGQLSLINNQKFGGIIVFHINVASPEITRISMDKIGAVNNSEELPLLIAIDEEGGVVSRLWNQLDEQTPQAEITNYEQAYNVGKMRGMELKNLGINMNFSPVMDYTPSQEAFLYNRVFHVDKKSITQLSDAMIKGYQDVGVVAVPKHYPGHPNDTTDSHEGLPVSYVSRNDFDKYTSQFKELVTVSEPKMIMVGHISFPNVDSQYPSTLSSIILEDILRDQYGFEGVVISDDINMGAIKESFQFEESAVRAIEAGNDILLFVTEPRFQLLAYKTVLQNIHNGRIPEERIDESVYRILKIKEDL